MASVNPMTAVPVTMSQRNSIVSTTSNATIQRRRGSILLGDEREVPMQTSTVNGAAMPQLTSPAFISPQQLYMTQLQAQIAQQQQAQIQQQQAMLLQMAMNQTPQVLSPQPPATPVMTMGMTTATPTMIPTQGHTQSHHGTRPTTKARSSFAVIDEHSHFGNQVADDEKADDLRSSFAVIDEHSHFG